MVGGDCSVSGGCLLALDLLLRKCEMLLVGGWANQGAWWLTACCWITIYHQDRTV